MFESASEFAGAVATPEKVVMKSPESLPDVLVNDRHTKTHDEFTRLTEAGPVTELRKRRYRDYRVVPVGHSIGKLGEKVVKRCVDESDAKSFYYEKFGIGSEPSLWPVKVELIGDSADE